MLKYLTDYITSLLQVKVAYVVLHIQMLGFGPSYLTVSDSAEVIQYNLHHLSVTISKYHSNKRLQIKTDIQY